MSFGSIQFFAKIKNIIWFNAPPINNFSPFYYIVSNAISCHVGNVIFVLFLMILLNSGSVHVDGFFREKRTVCVINIVL